MKRIRTKLLPVVFSLVMALTLLPMGVFAMAPPPPGGGESAKGRVDPIMTGAIEKIRERIAENGKYAVVSDLSNRNESGSITVTIIKEDYPLIGGDTGDTYDIAPGKGAYFDIFGTLVNELFMNRYNGSPNVYSVDMWLQGSSGSSRDSRIEFENYLLDKGFFSPLVETCTDDDPNLAAILTGDSGLIGDIGTLEGESFEFNVHAGDTRYTPTKYFIDFVPDTHVDTLEIRPAQPADCTEDGTIAYYECTLCGKKFKDESAKHLITDAEIVEKAAHKLDPHYAVSANCIKTGTKEYYECSACGKKFADENASTEITDADIAVEMTDHSWSEPQEENGYWVRICSFCGAKDIGQKIPAAQTPEAEIPTTPGTLTTPVTEAPTTEAPVATNPDKKIPDKKNSDKKTQAIETQVTKTSVNTIEAKVPKKLAMKTGQSTTEIQVPLTPGDSIVSVQSSNTKIAKVKVRKDGTIKVKAKKKTGTVKIKVRLASGKTVKFKVKVQKNRVLTAKVTAPEKLKLHVGQKIALAAKAIPVTTSEGFIYTSSNPKVAKVTKDGVVKALEKGTALITVASGNKKAVCKVKVR